ncbi:amino acid adenylation domain-containing protein [Actinoplanes oblitus]|uniref:Amino acid adenylation domain-containing protein n=1 Tax=Actinoplanes oblitus TaxID=3040509 RepID=A0ABY8WF67_9ACTN|nr:non-ribosomal peptide synthetase [Actinoplanes oblitus]WIM94380.1 amino acid adenylation domain-containing protein [Actinoplanes oblitus]
MTTDQQNTLDLIRRIRSLPPKRQRALLDLLRKQGVDVSALDGIPRFPRTDGVAPPLSYAQQRLWFLARLDGTSAHYNIPLALRLTGPLDRPALSRALAAVVRRHESLRTRLADRDGVPYQLIGDGEDFAVRSVALTGTARLAEIVQREAVTPFDLERDLPIRAQLLTLAEDDHVLQVTMHHSCSDGWSVGVFLRDLGALYEAFRDGRPDPLAPLPVQYADYAQWQREWLGDDVQARQVAYWQERLAGIDPTLTLPADRERPAVKTYEGRREFFSCPPELLTGLRELSERHGVTLYMTLLAAYAVVLHRYTGQSDVPVGTVVANRNRVETENLVGFFANTLVMRTDLTGDPAFSELLGRVRATALEAYDHQDVPFEAVVDALKLERSLAHAPVFQTMIVLQEAQTEQETRLGAATVSPVEFDFDVTKFDLTLDLRETLTGLAGAVEYNTALFDRETVLRFIAHWTELLAAVVRDPGVAVSRLPLASPAERRQVVEEWNDTARDFAGDRTLHELFEAAVARHPERVALVDADRSWTYAELNAWANRVAHTLRAHGVVPDQPVGLAMERSAEMVAGVYGILKAGGAYLPLEPSYPAARLAGLVESSGVAAVLVQPHLDAAPLAGAAHLLAVHRDGRITDRDGQPVAEERTDDPRAGAEPGGLAYVIHTSGSTGRPKGVMIEHRAAVNRIEWMQNEYRLTEDDVVLQKTPYSFDVSVWEFFWPLLSGARLAVAEPEAHRDPAALVAAINRFGVTTLHFVPSMLRSMVAEPGWSGCTTVRRVFASGEALPADLCAAHYARHRAPLHNLYGPTEAAVDVSHWTVPADQVPRVIPIGRPIQNIRLYVLNDALDPQGIGCVGQLHIAGAGLARGYLRQPELTRERFVPDPFGAGPDARLYRTGDLARWRADGTLEFLGRADDQVKLRGFRIELGEIEHRLAEHPMVRACAVVVREDQPGDQRLTGYVVPAGETTDALRDDLVRHLERTLPEYQVPSAFVLLDALPLTTHGKLDRKALPAPDIGAFVQSAYVAPATPTERILAELWADLLGFDAGRVGAGDNFFALGGHSLLITSLVARLAAAGLHATVWDVFSAPALSDLAALIDGAGTGGTEFQVPPNAIPAGCERITPEMLPLVQLNQEQIDAIVAGVPGGAPNLQDVYPLVPAQEGILFHHLVDPENDPYLMSALFVADDETAAATFTAAVQAVIDRHDVLRTAVVTAGLPEPVQVVHRSVELPVGRVRLDPARDAEEQARELLHHPAPMPVGRAPLFRLLIAEDAGSGRRYLLLAFHHLIEDATSLRLIMEELAAHVCDRAESLAPPAAYRDFVAHTRHQLATGDAEAYFRETLGDVAEPTTPFGLTDVRGDGRRTRKPRRSLDPALTERLRAEAKRLRLSPACLFHAACALVIGAAAGRDDVVFGTVMSGRLQGVPGVDRMLGNFINTLPLRVRLAGRTVRELIADVDTGLKELIAREQSSLSVAQRATGLDSDAPLFSAAVNFRHFEPRRGDAAQTSRVEERGIRWLASMDRTNYPMGISLDDLGTELSLTVQVEDRVEPEALLEYVETALGGIVSALAADDGTGTAALDVDVLPAAERRRQLAEWNGTGAGHPHDRCLAELFEEQVARRPGEVAVRHGDRTLTFAELNARANRVAHHLRRCGIGPDTLVGLCVDRSPELVIGMLGILKAGGAYVPIDPGYPEDRIHTLLQGAGVGVLLTRSDLPATLFEAVPEVVHLDTADFGDLPEHDLSRAETGLTPEHLAYAIFTSGSTGRPKGVLVEQRGVVRLLRNPDYFPPSDDTVFLHHSSISFDAGTQEVLTPLVAGGRLVLLDGDNKDVERLLDCVARTGVTTMLLSAAFLPAFAEAAEGRDLPLTYLAVVGEAFSARDVRRLFAAQPGLTVVNGYGPTENSIASTYHVIPRDLDENARIPIGRPVPRSTAYVTDSRLRLVPAGVAGELCVGGAGVARGYLDDPDLTAARFVPDPFGDEPGGRLYRTGDLARHLPDGTLEFLGRIDDQVKVRGFRVEPGEVESALQTHPAVHSAVVVPFASGETRSLAAYVRPTEEWLDTATAEQNTEHLEQWQKVFEDQYAEPAPAADATEGMNLAGWQSSYTGEPIPEPQMLEWIEGTVQRIADLRPKRLLEVGCGTGLLLFRYAESCTAVHALDISAAVLAEVRRGVERRGWSHVTLAHGDALSVQDLAGSTFDTVVLNSVVQYFPNRLYLEEVITRLLPLVADGGRILLGDIRNLDLFAEHLVAVERGRGGSRSTVASLAAQVQRRRRQETELLVSPTWFARLADRLPDVTGVDVLVKRGTGDNEMLAYRYDVVLTKGATRSAGPLPWRTATTAGELRDLLSDGAPDRFGVTGLTNPRIAEDVRVARGLTRWASTRQVDPLPAGTRLTATAAAEVAELEAVLAYAEELGYRVAATWSQDRPDGLDLVLGRGELPPVLARSPYRSAASANNPQIGRLIPPMVRTLKEHLATRLPDYLVPSAFVLLEELPVTPNGKVDKRALPAPDEADVATETYVPPRTETQRTLCRLMAGVLGLNRVGLRDTFFDLGGHSLLATRLTLRVKKELKAELPLQLILTGATVEEMAAVLAPAEPEPVPAAAQARPDEPAPLALQQRDLWFLRPSADDNVQLAIRVTGPLDRDAWTTAVRAVVGRHAILRTSYLVDGDEVRQRVNEDTAIEVPVLPVDDEAAVTEWLRAERARPFAPEDPFAIRVHLLALSGTDHVAVVTRPWGVFDGWSTGILLSDLGTAYQSAVHDGTGELPPLPLRYADFAREQRDTVGAAELDRQREYWSERLAGLPVLSLRTDYPRPPIRSYVGATVPVRVGAGLLDRLRALGQERGATLYMTLLSGFATLLGGITADREVLIGSPVTNRSRPELEELVGYFVNTVPMRLDISPELSFGALLGQVRQVSAEAQEHKDLPFRDLPGSPSCQVMFNLVPAAPAAASAEAGGIAVTPLAVESGTAKHDLNLSLQDTGDGLAGYLEYSGDLFGRRTATRLADAYAALLHAVAADPDGTLAELRDRVEGAR